MDVKRWAVNLLLTEGHTLLAVNELFDQSSEVSDDEEEEVKDQSEGMAPMGWTCQKEKQLRYTMIIIFSRCEQQERNPHSEEESPDESESASEESTQGTTCAASYSLRNTSDSRGRESWEEGEEEEEFVQEGSGATSPGRGRSTEAASENLPLAQIRDRRCSTPLGRGRSEST